MIQVHDLSLLGRHPHNDLLNTKKDFSYVVDRVCFEVCMHHVFFFQGSLVYAHARSYHVRSRLCT